MGSVSRILETYEEWPQSKPVLLDSEPIDAPSNRNGECAVWPDDEPLRAARGLLIGVALGLPMWALFLWALL